ncbi:T9SS type A sorting domain-containing protein [candidate division KSB1 bacterium]|nr:T9SS type A sorting domain-containing protein [candidate division KSB1 bacterium]
MIIRKISHTIVIVISIVLLLWCTNAIQAQGNYRLQRDGFTAAGGHLSSQTYQSNMQLSVNHFGQMNSKSYHTGPGTAVEMATEELPIDFHLQQNHPNPFNQSTQLRWRVARPGRVEIAVYSLLGRKVATLFDGHQVPGHYRLQYDGRDRSGQMLPSGIYFCRMMAAGYTHCIKLLIVR